jgi:GNAT domain-containint protein/GNAT acetyltransferase-like protein
MQLTDATEEEKVARDRLTHAPWGAPLDMDSWLHREAQLRAHRWSKAAMRTWFLRGEGGEVLSSCETFAMASTAGSEAGTTYGVASVFTEERLRGRGHATELLRRVHARVAAEDPRAQAFILFSEVGAGIYERAGYVARPEWDEDLVFPPSHATGPGAAEPEEEEALARVLACAPPLQRRGFVAWPSAEQLDWHRERERIYAQALGRPRAPGCGARHRDGIAVWTGNLRSNRLYLLLLRADTAEAASALVESARRAAAAAGLGAVHLWKCPLPEGWTAASASGRVVPRDQALPMLHPLKPGVRAEDWSFIPRALWI